MKIFSYSITVFGAILLLSAVGGCGTLATTENDGVVGAKIGGIEGVMPNSKNTQNNSYQK